jgi:hypothetical protein
MIACTPSTTIRVKETVLAPKPTAAMPLLQRGGLSLASERDQRSHVLTMYTQNAISGPQTTIPPRMAAMRSFIRNCNPILKKIVADEMGRHKVTSVLVSRSKTQFPYHRVYANCSNANCRSLAPLGMTIQPIFTIRR